MTQRPGYEVTGGADLAYWAGDGAFRLPGDGGEALATVPAGDGIHAVLAEPGESLPAGGGDRAWERAQAAERAFWQRWRSMAVYQRVSLEAYWAGVVEKTGGPFPPGKVLDVGCGPVSVLNFFRGEGVRPLGIDPLASFYHREKLVETRPGWEPAPMVSLPAERLPFPDRYFDTVLCFNVLDHVRHPRGVIGEIVRVARPGGNVRVFVHTFSRWAKRLLFFDTPHVNHWDRAEFRRLLEGAGLRVESDLHERKTFDVPPGLLNALKHLPYRLAARVMFTDYYQLEVGA
ncbi:MAG: class I SAM-dependent methyltransferase [Acidobacteria bacterium]|nr:class I SAM-dependent methyltransferase [Acidobacteriota bacterium]